MITYLLKINNVFNAVSQPPNSSATVLPRRAITVKILYFMLAFLHFSLNPLKKGYRKGSGRGTASLEIDIHFTIF